MNNSNVYDRIRARIKPATCRYVRKNMAIAMRIADILTSKGWTQKDLADAMGESELVMEQWLVGMRDLSLKDIALMESVLEAEILTVSKDTLKDASDVG